MRFLLILTLGFTGCAGAYGLSGTPEQLHEMVKVKDATGICTEFNTPWGPQRTTALSVDKGIYGASLEIGDQCKLKMSINPFVPKPEPPKP